MQYLQPLINPGLKRCFIAAATGLDLKFLPNVLAERNISWEWANEEAGQLLDPMEAIRSADFLIGIFTGGRRDFQIVYQVGIAIGMGKPVFLLTTRRMLPFDLSQITVNRIPLSVPRALGLHLDIFLRTPKRKILESEDKQWAAVPPSLKFPRSDHQLRGHSALENRAYEIIERHGGGPIAQPYFESSKTYRPDLLAWLGNFDAELLDPTVIEVKGRVDLADVKKLEEQLLTFMQSTGIRTGFVLTSESQPTLQPTISPYIFWLGIEEFENLLKDSRLGSYVRETRNRAMHGLRDATT